MAVVKIKNNLLLRLLCLLCLLHLHLPGCKKSKISSFSSPPTPLPPFFFSSSAPPPPPVKMKRQRRRRRVVCPAIRISPVNTLCHANQAPRRPAAIGCGGESLARRGARWLFVRREAPHTHFLVDFSGVFFFFGGTRFASRDWMRRNAVCLLKKKLKDLLNNLNLPEEVAIGRRL